MNVKIHAGDYTHNTRETMHSLPFLTGILCLTATLSYAQPIDKRATPEVKKLYKTLLSTMKNKQIYFGQQDATAYGVDWKSESNQSDMMLVAGTHPAVYGWEISGIEVDDAKNIDGIDFREMRQLIAEAYERGGLITISWHTRNPVNDMNSWDNQSVSSIDSILPGAAFHEKYKGYLDRVSSFLLSLTTPSGKLIPVIFRPFHELTGDWFWWGAKQNQAESYRQLWRFTVNYLRDTKNLHHLLYAYSPDRTPVQEQYFERYPGDEYVDILGYDCYHFGGADTAEEFVKHNRSMLQYISENARKRKKPAAFTETGLETVNQTNWWTGVLYPTIDKVELAYVMVWRNAYERPNHFYGPTPGHPANPDFMKFIRYHNIITGNKLNKK